MKLLTAILLLTAAVGGQPARADDVVVAPHPALDAGYAIAIPRLLSWQGKLTDTLGQPVVDTTYSVAFRLYTAPTGGSPFWNETQMVTTKSGLFSVLLGSVTPIGSVPSAGKLYLGMVVGGGSEMTPRLRIVSAAYAYKADTANYALTGGTPENAWVRSGSDSVLYTVNQLGIARGGSNNALYGTRRFTHVNFGVECTTGTSGQSYDYVTVGGGYRNTASGDRATVGGGYRNAADTVYATVGGGYINTASGDRATVGGGGSNRASGDQATVGGGRGNIASGAITTVGGGNGNEASANLATVGGGAHNEASAIWATVGGGDGNEAGGYGATVGGGGYNAATTSYATVGGGSSNRASGEFATVGGGSNNDASGVRATVGGGGDNVASDSFATVAGGYADTAAARWSFAAGRNSVVPVSFTNSAAFNGQTASASNQTRVGILSKASGTFTIDHPLDPSGKILNHYFIEGPEMRNIYDGEAVLDASGRAAVMLPDYFDALNRGPRVQLTGVGTSGVVYVAKDVSGNRFVIGGPSRAKVYWQVTGERKDVSAEATRRMMPVEQLKTGALAGRMLDDDFLAGCMKQLDGMGESGRFAFRTAAGRARYEQMKQMTAERQ